MSIKQNDKDLHEESTVMTYSNADLKEGYLPYEMPKHIYGYSAGLGFECTKRNNLIEMEPYVLLTSAGNVLQFIDLQTLKKSTVIGWDSGGIGALAVHPSKDYFAVGGKGVMPNVYIYQYPSLEVVSVLKKGTERSYSSLAFSHNGEKLASVGGSPDFLLTLWDWKTQRIILRSKAFGQEVFNVRFSPNDDGFLTTSGTGHICFWKMANTFTGLKLQGSIGKFGKIELSDIETFGVFADGKVLSATERGVLLLWDGNFIKCEIVMKDKSFPHRGNVNVILMNEKQNQIVTAGCDGKIIFWAYTDIDTADALEDETIACVEPIKVIDLGENVDVYGVLEMKKYFLIQDRNGSLRTVSKEDDSVTVLLEFHAGPINAVGTSPSEHFAATAGCDGSLTCWDYVRCELLFRQQHEEAATALQWAPTSVDTSGRTCVTGFADGVLRVFYRNVDCWKRVQVMKPHETPITCIEFSPDGTVLTTSAQDATIFFFTIEESAYTPLGFVQCPGNVNSICWNENSSKLLVACSDGTILEMEKPTIFHKKDQESFELTVEFKTFHLSRNVPMSLKELQDVERNEEDFVELLGEVESKMNVEKLAPHELFSSLVDGSESAALTAQYVLSISKEEEESEETTSAFYATYSGTHAGKIFKCSFEASMPLDTYFNLSGNITQVSYSSSKKLLLTAGENGEFRIQTASTIVPFVRGTLHDGFCSKSCKVALSYNDAFVLSIGGDGLLIVGRLNLNLLDVTSRKFTRVLESKSKARTIAVFAAEVQEEANQGRLHQKMQARLAAGEDVRVTTSSPALPKLAAAKAQLVFDSTVFEGEVAADDFDGYLLMADPLSLEDSVFPIEAPTFRGTADEEESAAVDDISGKETYSIQHAKLQLEKDLRCQSSDEKKENTRNVISKMRLEFQELYETNQALAQESQCTADEMDMDEAYSALMEKKGLEMVAEVQHEMEFEREKSALRVSKVHAKFLEHISVELISMTSFSNNIRIQSYRCPRLYPKLLQRLQSMQDVSSTDALFDHDLLQNISSPSSEMVQPSVPGSPSERNEVYTVHSEETRLEEKEAPVNLHGFEARKALRLERKKQMELMMSQKPGENVEDPRDLAAIASAKELLGDYKLKTSKTYVVPENQRVNTETKITEMATMEERIHVCKMKYNEKFLELRNHKESLLQTLAEDHVRLCSIATELGQNPPQNTVPVQNPKEWPERRDGFHDKNVQDLITNFCESTYLASMGQPTCPIGAPSENEMREERIYRGNLEREQRCIAETFTKSISEFDANVLLLRYDKMKMDVIVKTLEMTLMELSQELQLLQTFEDKDLALDGKRNKCNMDRDVIAVDMAEYNTKTSIQKKALEKGREKERELHVLFQDLVNESSPFYEVLLKLYKRKIKRTKNAAMDDDQGGEGDEESEEDYDDDGESEEESEGEEGEEVAPLGCDQSLFEKIMALREKKLEVDEHLADLNKNMDELKKNTERMLQKARSVDKELSATQLAIQVFQTEKQNHFNTIQVMVCLSLNTIKVLETEEISDGNTFLEKSNLPENIDHCLVFSKSILTKLHARIGELGTENRTLRQTFKDLHKEKSRLFKDNNSQGEAIAASLLKCDELQMLKFGRLIDLEALDQSSVSNHLVELNQKVHVEEINNVRELAKLKSGIQNIKLQALHATNENTELLEAIAAQSQRQFKLEMELNATNVEATLDDNTSDLQRDMEERSRLVQLVKLQYKEVDALKSEIGLLRNKSGHVYVPVDSHKVSQNGPPTPTSLLNEE